MSKLPWGFIIRRTLTNTLIIGALLYILLVLGPMLKMELGYRWRAAQGAQYSLDANETSPSAVKLVAADTPVADESYFANKPTNKSLRPLKITPADTQFGLVIEKIGVNVPVVANVDSASYEEYTEALRSGVAHAKGSKLPGEMGNIYIHGHSSLGFWQLGKYATVFTLLSKLEPGDRVVLFYKDQRFDYEVFNKETFPGYDITPMIRNYEESVLTLQTCDPPGTTLNRLVVSARLVDSNKH